MEIDWLHLSDLHLKEASYDQNKVLSALESGLKREQRRGWKPQLVFITGDLAYSGEPRQYQQVGEFLTRLQQWLAVPKQNIFVIPGNHDVARRMAGGLQRTLNLPREADEYVNVANNHFVKFKAFSDWHNEYFSGTDRRYSNDTTCQSFETIIVNGHTIGVMRVNSALFSLDDEDRGKLWVIERFLEQAIASKQDVDVSFALIHHPLEWLDEREYNKIKVKLDRHFDVILRGHLHRTETDYVTRTGDYRALGAAQRSSVIKLAAGAMYQDSENPNKIFLGRAIIGRNAFAARIRPLHYIDDPATTDRTWALDTGVFPDGDEYEGCYPPDHFTAGSSTPLCVNARQLSGIVKSLHSAEARTRADHSDLFLAFVEVNPPNRCKDACDWIRTEFQGNKCAIEGVYDLYGPTDILVKIRSSDNFEETIHNELVRPLGERGFLGRKVDDHWQSKPRIVNLLWEERAAVTPEGCTSTGDPLHLKAFFEIQYFRGNPEDIIRKTCIEVTNDQDNVALQAFYGSNERVFVELILLCGGFYNLAHVVIGIEKRLAELGDFRRTTVLAMSLWERSAPVKSHPLERERTS